MGPFTFLALLRGRGSLYALLGALLLSTLWVSSLTLISDRSNATELLTDVGVSVLNPFLVNQGYGFTQQTYDSRASHLNQALPLTPLNVQVTGNDINKLTYDQARVFVYQRVAVKYYDNGPSAALTIPGPLQQFAPFLDGFGFFSSSSSGVPSASGLPDFLQPFFTIILLTPATFTASGHDNLLHLLPWFWLVTLVVGAAAVLFGRSGQKISALAKTVTHSSWPIVLVLVGAWIASLTFYKEALAPYTGALGVVDRTFLPVYGGALVLGLVGVFLPKLLSLRQPAQARVPVPAGVPAQVPMGAQMGMPTSTTPWGSSSPMPPSGAAPGTGSPFSSGGPPATAPTDDQPPMGSLPQ